MTNDVQDQERVQYLLARQGSGPSKKIALAAWPRPDKELPQVSLEVTWVRFSTLNHRTKSEQMRIIETRQTPDLFISDPMGEEAQAEQFAILSGQEGFADLKADLKQRGQQQVAIVTAEGVLINGNRRAAALRSLFKDDDYQPARYINCLVLPSDATVAELVDLETELQIAREFKENYTWVNEALLIEEIFNRENKDWARVASRMHRDAGDVRDQYDKLQQLHQLVALSSGTRHHADFVPNESAFTELAKHIKGKSPQEAASVRAAYFLGTLTGVNYRTLRHLRRGDASALVKQELSEDVTLLPLLAAADPATSHGTDVLDDLLGGEPPSGATDLTKVLTFFASQGRAQEVRIGASTVAVADLMNTVRNGIDRAAEEANNQSVDESAVTAPTTNLANAIRCVNKAISALPRARVLAQWNDAAFNEQVKALRTLVSQLDQKE